MLTSILIGGNTQLRAATPRATQRNTTKDAVVRHDLRLGWDREIGRTQGSG
jgi:hypothetical protein